MLGLNQVPIWLGTKVSQHAATSTGYGDDSGRDIRLACHGLRRRTRLPASSVATLAPQRAGVGAGRWLCRPFAARGEPCRVLVRLPVGRHQDSKWSTVAILPVGAGSGVREREECDGPIWKHPGRFTDKAVAESSGSNRPSREMANQQHPNASGKCSRERVLNSSSLLFRPVPWPSASAILSESSRDAPVL